MSDDSLSLASDIDVNGIIDDDLVDAFGNVAEWLSYPDQDQLEAAKEMYTIYSQLKRMANSIHKIAENRALLDLLRVQDKWLHLDSGKDEFEKAWSKYKAITWGTASART